MAQTNIKVSELVNKVQRGELTLPEMQKMLFYNYRKYLVLKMCHGHNESQSVLETKNQKDNSQIFLAQIW